MLAPAVISITRDGREHQIRSRRLAGFFCPEAVETGEEHGTNHHHKYQRAVNDFLGRAIIRTRNVPAFGLLTCCSPLYMLPPLFGRLQTPEGVQLSTTGR